MDVKKIEPTGISSTDAMYVIQPNCKIELLSLKQLATTTVAEILLLANSKIQKIYYNTRECRLVREYDGCASDFVQI